MANFTPFMPDDEIYTIDEFTEQVRLGIFIPYKNCIAYYATKDNVSNTRFPTPNRPIWATHVVYYKLSGR